MHLTDLHFGRHAAVNNATRLLLDDLSIESRDVPVDVVLVTGDIAFSGDEDDYTLARVFFEEVRSILRLGPAELIFVPGNHDVDIKRGHPPAVDRMTKANRDRWLDEAGGRAARLPSMQRFAAYEHFVTENCYRALAPSQNLVRTIDHGGHSIVLVNTAALSHPDYDPSADARPPFPIGALRGALAQNSGDSPIVLGHHPISWFKGDSGPVLRALRNANALYLHGHEHRIIPIFDDGGLRALGFGAVFERDPDSTPDARKYSNSYGIFERRDTGVVGHFREWNHEDGHWVPLSSFPSGLQGFTDPASPWLRHRLTTGGATRPTATLPTRPILEDLLVLDVPKDADVRPLLARILPDLDDLRIQGNGTTGTFLCRAGRRGITLIASPGHVFTRKDLDETMRRWDYESEMDSYVVVTLGTIGGDVDPAISALRLQRSIDLIRPQMARAQLGQVLLNGYYSAVPASHRVELVLCGKDVGLLVTEPLHQRSFVLIAEDGVLPAQHPWVSLVRSARAHLVGATYGLPDATTPPSVAPQAGAKSILDAPPFGALAYRAELFERHNRVEYSALASMGIRLSGAKLIDHFVETQAEISTDGAAGYAIGRVIRDAVENLGVDPADVPGIEGYLRRRAGLTDSPEVETARALFRDRGTVAVIGEPGSGKTCFVKREILGFAKPDVTDAPDWYKQHLPVFVPLARVSQLMAESRQEGAASLPAPDALLTAIAEATAVPRAVISDSLATGRLACFFDGLDEISEAGLRVVVADAVGTLVSQYRALGNRFVVTSRPSAAEAVDLGRTFETVVLRGLSRSEMWALISNSLRARIGGNATAGITLTLEEQRPEDRSLAQALMADLDRSPDLMRLAENPLLLTLLVSIYANSGAANAKRHRVFNQAVHTLVNVRARASGHRPLKESDVRKRLSAVALRSLIEGTDALPGYDRAVELVAPLCPGATDAERSAEAVAFLAAADDDTGIILRSRSGGGTYSHVAFMHQSFLEYFAAQGLRYLPTWEQHVGGRLRDDSWRPVLALLSGILSDEGDEQRLITAILSAPEEIEGITLHCLQFALDCALEADVVSPQVAQELVRVLLGHLTRGSLPWDSNLCVRLGLKFAALVENSGAEEIVSELSVAATQNKGVRRAAVVLFLSLACRGERALSMDVLRELCNAADGYVASAICGAAARSAAFRVEPVYDTLRRSLGGTGRARRAAVAACKEAPELARVAVTELSRVAANMGRPKEAVAAALALLQAMPTDMMSSGTREVLRLPLETLGRHAVPGQLPLAISVPRVVVDELFAIPGGAPTALSMVPWVRADNEWVRAVLLRYATGKDPGLAIAALRSLRLSDEGRAVLRSEDKEAVLDLALRSPSKEVRRAGLYCVAEVALDSAQVYWLAHRLEDHERGVEGDAEYQALVAALGRHVNGPGGLHAADVLRREIRRVVHQRRFPSARTASILRAAAQGRVRLLEAGNLQSLIGGHGASRELKSAALDALVACHAVTDEIVDCVVAWVRKPPLAARPPGADRAPASGLRGQPAASGLTPMGEELVRATAALLRRARGDPLAIRSLGPRLADLRAGLVERSRELRDNLWFSGEVREALELLSAVDACFRTTHSRLPTL